MTVDLAGYRNVPDALADRARLRPEHPALIVSPDGGPDGEEVYTHAELLARIGRSARRLSARLKPGSRVVLALPSGVGFVESYFGCLTAGMVAVPVPPPGGSAQARARIEQIVRDCGPALVLTEEREVQGLAETVAQAGLQDCAVETPAVAQAAAEERAALPEAGRDTLGVLQYSSGSTGEPKGVMVSHGNVLANAELFCRANGAGQDDVFGGWIPLHHDMGLFAMLSSAVLAGATVVLMPPTSFVRRPATWLRLIDRHRISVSAAPSFAFELCVRLVPKEQADAVDLSSLHCVINGSEPVHVPTLRAFTERFAAAGFAPEAMTPGYGLAEATVYVSTKPPRQRPALFTTAAGGEVAGCGLPIGFELRIVDPGTRLACAPGGTGEIWVSGESVGQGYWNRPGTSEETFRATLADSAADTRWLRTGDLGSVRQGELVITGRLKEMMVIRGRNVFPQDVEHEARTAHPLLAGFSGAAFAVQAPEDRVVLVHEISPVASPEEFPALVAAVRRQLTGVLGSPLRDVVLLRRGAVRRTTSGKIQRGTMRSLFLEGGLAPVYADLSPEVRGLLPA
ncbi:fatty acyl-AMP ligase [Streptomyces sasae]|uniref:fatty acyl-AMP ligase n=1 Tax=Streptomyces sasae TaxID=1266772 RepID=UPI00293168B1|nr:fatty acyl-AMP ligase [Streptomyces sasae]